MSKESGFTIYKVTQLADEAPISVTTSATAYTMPVGIGYIYFQNSGTTPVWLGGASIDADTKRGVEILPKAMFGFENILESCKIYFQCTTAASTGTISLIKG